MRGVLLRKTTPAGIARKIYGDILSREEMERTCYCFGGVPWWKESGRICNISIFDLQTSSKNTCAELGGTIDEYNICSFPLQNASQLKERQHPQYYENEMDQQAYAALVECAQAHTLFREVKGEAEFIEMATKTPVARIERVEKVKAGEIETAKVRDIYLTKKDAERLLESVSNVVIESCAEEKYAWRVHGKSYFDLDERDRRKLRYRIKKQFGEF